MRRIIFLTLVILLASAGMSPVAAAQTNETAVESPADLVYQFENGVELRDISYENGSANVHLVAPDRPVSVGIAEGNLEANSGFNWKSVRLRPNEERIVSLAVRDEAVSITSGDDGYYAEGDLGITVTTTQPTAQDLQIAGFGSIIGSMFSVGIVIGQLRRKHENSYKELFSDERHRIETDPVEGYYEKALDAVKRSKETKAGIILSVLTLAYTVGVLSGQVMGPGEAWIAMSDTQRILVASSIAATFIAISPAYLLIKKIWNPMRDFILDLDSKDVYSAHNGDKSGGVAAYSGPPSRVDNLEVDGSVTTMGTPGGRVHLVRNFDPEENTAEANPPELADDREVSIEVQKIDHNRKILTDLATIGRDLIGAMSAFRVTADAAAMKDIDSGIRNTVSVGSDSLEDVLSDAVAGTRYEGTYQPDIDQIDTEGTQTMTDDTDDADELTDDGGTDDE